MFFKKQNIKDIIKANNQKKLESFYATHHIDYIDSEGYTGLIIATMEKKHELVQYFIDNSADPYIEFEGKNAIDIALLSFDFNLLSIFLQNGHSLSEQIEDQCLIHFLLNLKYRNYNWFKQILPLVQDIQARNEEDQSALDMLLSRKFTDIKLARLLLDFGIEVTESESDRKSSYGIIIHNIQKIESEKIRLCKLLEDYQIPIPYSSELINSALQFTQFKLVDYLILRGAPYDKISDRNRNDLNNRLAKLNIQTNDNPGFDFEKIVKEKILNKNIASKERIKILEEIKHSNCLNTALIYNFTKANILYHLLESEIDDIESIEFLLNSDIAIEDNGLSSFYKVLGQKDINLIQLFLNFKPDLKFIDKNSFNLFSYLTYIGYSSHLSQDHQSIEERVFESIQLILEQKDLDINLLVKTKYKSIRYKEKDHQFLTWIFELKESLRDQLILFIITKDWDKSIEFDTEKLKESNLLCQIFSYKIYSIIEYIIENGIDLENHLDHSFLRIAFENSFKLELIKSWLLSFHYKDKKYSLNPNKNEINQSLISVLAGLGFNYPQYRFMEEELVLLINDLDLNLEQQLTNLKLALSSHYFKLVDKFLDYLFENKSDIQILKFLYYIIENKANLDDYELLDLLQSIESKMKLDYFEIYLGAKSLYQTAIIYMQTDIVAYIFEQNNSEEQLFYPDLIDHIIYTEPRIEPIRRAKMMDLFVEKGFDINSKNAKGETALILASYYGLLTCVRNLIKHKANVNAIDTNHCTPINYLMSGDMDYEFSYTNSFSETQKTHILHELIKQSANINHADNNGNTALHIAVARHYNHIFSSIIAYGVDLNQQNKNGESPILLAIKYRNNFAFQQLMNTNKIKFNKIESSGDSLLFSILKFTDTSKLREYFYLLFDKLDNPNTTNNNKQTLLHYAVERNDLEIIDFILERYPDLINKTDNYGQTAFLVLVKNTVSEYNFSLHKKTMLALINKAANIDAQDYLSNTALKIAQTNKNKQMELFLLEHGANPNLGKNKIGF
ncbi:MAG: hypothetical protein N4A49_15740 [Marinifilaceae bacterium]|jgi:ankyrin repeat protein|nr:hypothetical protein [Marinifilaceae bacterium]